jgi:hypothetical protein
MSKEIEEMMEPYLVNDYFFSKFFPTIERICHVDKSMPYANNTIYRNFILYGSPGTGKTTTANSIAGHGINKYGINNVNAKFSENGNLEFLMHRGLDPKKLVNILFTDNATLAIHNKETLVKYFTLRNQYFDKRKEMKVDFNHNGYILSIISLHRYHSVPVDLRSIVDAIIIRDVSLNPYDQRVIKQFINDSEISALLNEIADLRFDSRELMNYSIIVSRGKTGILKLNPTDKFYFSEPETMREILRRLHDTGNRIN